ncbi:hypothetical protein PVAND_007689 [Polypedilum vanderplanki]|uniref:OBP47-like domain-containing protein n=1 Tax=Polypedilum vanderplanki TaxID=319348 RepID=A0A9J6C7D0_POLVA|nr:hypothetical protein PVAND_007689 [Polypedilum vanderplanki]
MKLTVFISFFVCIGYISNAFGIDCDKFQVSKAKECCKMPRLKDVDKVKRIFDEIRARDVTASGPMVECKFSQQMLNESKLIKDNDFDKDGVIKYIDTAIEDDRWKQIFKTSFQDCYKEVSDKFADIQKRYEDAPLNIKKDQCNVKFMAVKTCTILESFKKCPDDVSSKEKECIDLKDWVSKCRSNVYSFTEVAMKIQQKPQQ